MITCLSCGLEHKLHSQCDCKLDPARRIKELKAQVDELTAELSACKTRIDTEAFPG